jgi:PadR family transcriptional regulator, regulatory protein PadR
LADTFRARAVTELRRGVLQVAVLSLLREPAYGYDLLRVLSEAGLATEEGTLYPVLRRLEGEGLLDSVWDTSGSRPRKYYRTTDEGRESLEELAAEWRRVSGALGRVLAEEGADADRDPGPGAA